MAGQIIFIAILEADIGNEGSHPIKTCLNAIYPTTEKEQL